MQLLLEIIVRFEQILDALDRILDEKVRRFLCQIFLDLRQGCQFQETPLGLWLKFASFASSKSCFCLYNLNLALCKDAL